MDHSTPLRYKTLRLALAMRGGVSLAVWIGGAVAELDLFRRACNSPPDADGFPGCVALSDQQHERARIYADLLRKTPFENVEIDILAGASAGGLNAVLLGLAQSRGVAMDEVVHRTWIEKGGIWNLLRGRDRGRGPDRGGVQSILQGDGYLLAVIKDALTKIGDIDNRTQRGRRGPVLDPDPAVAKHVSVELAATLLEDRHQPNRDNAVGFSFTRRPGGLRTQFSTIPGEGDRDCDVDLAVERMALAARSTSSFPGAFEPATIYSYRGEKASAGANMARCFPYARSPEDPGNTDEYAFDVVDGGIFDNIPIDRAIRAIQRAPASQPTERRLVYLDPEPPSVRQSDLAPTAKRAERQSATSWIPVIRKSMALKQRSERADDELTLLLTHNHSVQELRSRLEAFAALLSTVPGADPRVSSAQYLQCRIGTDARRFALVLSDPWSELCRPPRASADYGVLPCDDLLQLKSKVASAYASEATGADLERDVYAILDAARVLLAWAHALEALTASHSGGTREDPVRTHLAKQKSAVYRLIALAYEARLETIDKILALEPGRHAKGQDRWETPQNPAGYCLDTRLGQSWCEQRSLTVPSRLLGLAGSGDSAGFYEGLDEWHEILTDIKHSDAPAVIFQAAMWDRLESLRVSIQAETAEATALILQSPTANESARRVWNESVFRHLGAGGPLDVHIIEVGKIFAVTGIPSTGSVIEYDEITSNETPTIDVPELYASARAKHLGTWLRKMPEPAVMEGIIADKAGLMNADTKLAGNALSRFGGFFKWTWRENDWQWGRLDAASGIVKVLENATSDLRVNTLSESAQGPRLDTIARLQSSILEDSKADAPPADGQHPLVTTVGGDTLAAIGPHYRFALASRVLPLAMRACHPGKDSRWSFGGIATRLGLIIATLVGVALALVADPLRLVWAMVTILAAATLMGAGTASLGVQTTFYAIIIIAGLLMCGGSIDAHGKWRRLHKRVETIHRTMQEAATRARTDADAKAKADAKTKADAEADAKTKAEAAAEAGEWSTLVKGADQQALCRWSCGIGVVLSVAAAYLLAAPHAVWIPDPGIHTSLETFIVAMVAIAAGQYWLYQRAHRLRPPPSVAPSRGPGNCWGFGYRHLAGFLAMAAAIGVAVVANYLTGKEHFPDSWGFESVDNNLFVAAAAGAVLAGLSVWGWVERRWAAVVIPSCGLLALIAQHLLDNRFDSSEAWAIWDLLPAGVWIVFLALIVRFLPACGGGFGEPPVPEAGGSVEAVAQAVGQEGEPASTVSGAVPTSGSIR